jgi:cobalamin biosynthesis protein CobD/CbiB
MDKERGFIGSLFDFSFTEFITTKLIRFLFGLGVFIAGVFALLFIASGFRQSAVAGVLFLVVSPLMFLLYVIIVRVALELTMVMFSIEEHTKQVLEQLKKGS